MSGNPLISGPGIDPLELAKIVGVDINAPRPNGQAATNGTAADINAREAVDPIPQAVQDALKNPVLKDDGTVDQSKTTRHVAAVCAEANLNLEQTRWVVDQDPDLAARAANLLARSTPLDDVRKSWEEARVRNAFMRPQQPSGGQQSATPVGPSGRLGLTDALIGAHIADTYLKSRFLITKELGWMEYDGKRWISVAEPVIGEAVRLGVLDLYGEEMQAGSSAERLKAISALFSANRIFAIVRIAKGYLWARTAEFDSHPDLLNVANGVVDLRDGSLGPHDPALLFTKLCPTNYVPGATHADWVKALAALPDDEVRSWLRVRFGQSITGYTTPDDVLVFLQGGGENGKTTMVVAIQRSAGLDYVVTLPDRVLLGNNNDHPTEMMTLRGARLAFMEELPDQHLNIKRLKDTHGKGSLSARYCGKDPVEWEPTHSIWVTTNHKPQIDEPEHAVWRRLAMVIFPFRYRKKHEPLEGPNDRHGDPGLRERVRLGKQGRHEAVLAWLIEGAMAWYQNGQQMPEPPAVVEAAKQAWRGDADVLLRFACDELVPADYTNTATADNNVMSTELYQHFAEWQKVHGQQVWGDRLFTARMEQHSRISRRGVEKKRLYKAAHEATLSRKPIWATQFGSSNASSPVPDKYSAWLGVRFRLPADSFDPYGPEGW